MAPALVLIAETDPPALPVTLVDFDAVGLVKTAVLSWSTTFETNSGSFDIERSIDGKQWVKLGSVNAQGESKSMHHYTITDKSPQQGGPSHGENLYRLKMLDRATGRRSRTATTAYLHIAV